MSNKRYFAGKANTISLRRSAGLSLCACLVLSSFFANSALALSALASFRKDTDAAMQKRDYDKALATAKQGLNKFPHDTWLLCRASILAVYLEKDAEAVRYREMAMKEPGLTLENCVEMVTASRELEDFKRAYEIAEFAAHKFPNNPKLLICLAENLRSTGRFRESRTLFERYLQKEPGNLGIWLDVMDNSRDLADWRAVIQAGDKLEATTAIDKTARSSIIFARCLAAKGNAHMRLREFKLARSCFEKAMLIMPMDRVTLNSHLNACREMLDLQAVKQDQAKLADFDKGL